MKYLLIFILTFSFSFPTFGKAEAGSKKLEFRMLKKLQHRVPVIHVMFDGAEWRFSSGDFTNETFAVMFDEIVKADNEDHVVNGFSLVIDNQYSIEEASSVVFLTPRTRYYMMGAYFEGSTNDIRRALYENGNKKREDFEKRNNLQDVGFRNNSSDYENLLFPYYEAILKEEYVKLKNSNQKLEPTVKTPVE